MRILSNTILGLFCLLSYLSVISQTRDSDPVVIKGGAVPCMAGVAPASIVAFKFSGTSWIQIPVQIDEVVIKDIKAPYGPNTCLGQSDQNIAWNIPFYADANTFTGADTDPLFDNDDELVFMAKDAGSRTTTCNYPAATLPNTLCELTVKDPVTNAVWGYVYLFKQNGTLNPSAGISYVNYNFTYANNYLSTYNVCSGQNNNENSTITTSRYFMRFTGKWIEEELKITAGNSTGVDILDRHQAFVAINNCFRSENTFSSAEGPVVTSKSGPVRAIRSVMGTNSGVFTQLTILFTESRVDYIHNFRVHPIGGFYDVYDLNANATGMQYYNNQNQAGATINGIQDIINTTNYNQWELYTGSQGSLAVSYDYNTDMTIGTAAQVQAGTADAALDAYYDDAGNNAAHKCTGDGLAYGSSGFHLITSKCTDRRRPDNGCGTAAKSFTGQRYHYLLPPNTTIANAIIYRSFVLNPLVIITGACPVGCIMPAETHTSIACKGGTSTVTISASGGTPPYTGTGTFTQSAGTQSYTVADASGCSNTIPVTITEPTLLVVVETHTSIACKGGTSTVMITASGGTPPYTGTGTFTQPAGTQSYTVTDANGCSKAIPVTITWSNLLVPVQPSAINGNAQPSSGIYRYSVELVSGVSYNWTISGGGIIIPNGNSADINWTAPGLYTITLTPFNSCGNGPSQILNIVVTNFSGSENILVLPNPVSGSLFVFNSSSRKLKYYQVISSTGAKVQSGNLPLDNNTSIELSFVASGIYILVLSDIDRLPVKRFVFFKK